MITKADIEMLSAEEKLELIHAAWESFVSNPESLPVSEAEKRVLLQRSQAHRQDPGSSLSEEEFSSRLRERFGRDS